MTGQTLIQQARFILLTGIKIFKIQNYIRSSCLPLLIQKGFNAPLILDGLMKLQEPLKSLMRISRWQAAMTSPSSIHRWAILRPRVS